MNLGTSEFNDTVELMNYFQIISADKLLGMLLFYCVTCKKTTLVTYCS